MTAAVALERAVREDGPGVLAASSGMSSASRRARRMASAARSGRPSEALGLLALMLLTEARRPARTDAAGASVGLADQDRTRWDAAVIAEGTDLIDRAVRLRRPGHYQLQAAIAALHARAPSFEDTDWPQIAALYAELHRRTPTPVVAVNRAVAVGFADGPAAGLALLDAVVGERGLAAYVPLHAARADLLRRAGDHLAADAAYAAAIAATQNAPQRADLERRRAAAARGWSPTG